MPALVIVIVISLAFYVFYKIKYVRCRKPAEKKWLSAKSGIALGVFVSVFGINQLFLTQSTVTYIVCRLFLLISAINIWSGIKAYQFYLPHAIKEAESNS